VILTFRDGRTEQVWHREHVSSFSLALQRSALRKLLMIDAAETIGDLRSPPGNHLEKLVGDREGEWSIRINEQWRVCFNWTDAGATNVEVVDYH
jgi:proteic killer suppression protein